MKLKIWPTQATSTRTMLFLHEQVTRTIVLAPSLGSSIVSSIFAQHQVDSLFIHIVNKALYSWIDLTLFTKHIPLINLIISRSFLHTHDTRLLSARPNTLREYHRYKYRLSPRALHKDTDGCQHQRHCRMFIVTRSGMTPGQRLFMRSGTTSVPPGVASAQ